MEKRYYIAYGSNLNIRQMRMRCPSARIIGTSKLNDYELPALTSRLRNVKPVQFPSLSGK